MARHTIYLDDVTELIIDAAELQRDGEAFSTLVTRAMHALLGQLPEARQRRAFREAAAMLEERMRSKAAS